MAMFEIVLFLTLVFILSAVVCMLVVVAPLDYLKHENYTEYERATFAGYSGWWSRLQYREGHGIRLGWLLFAKFRQRPISNAAKKNFVPAMWCGRIAMVSGGLIALCVLAT